MSSNEPIVSVIIPVYNVERYLRECLNSVVGQTLQEIEIICVNDGSTDGSAAILKEYEKADSRITVISQENKGLSAARNCGIRGDYIEKEALEILVRLAEDHDADSVHFATRPFYESEELHRTNNLDGYFDMKDFSGIYSGLEYIRTAREKYNYIATVWTALRRRSLLLDNGIAFINGILHEDEPFTFLADLASKRVVMLPTVLHYYGIRSASIATSKKTHKNVIGIFRGAMALLEHSFVVALDAESAVELRYAYSRLINDTAANYALLPPEEQEKVVFPKELENELFRQIIHNPAEKLDKAYASRSYRIGRTITLLPRKLQGGAQCIRDHGTGYTIRRMMYHMGLWKDEEAPSGSENRPKLILYAERFLSSGIVNNKRKTRKKKTNESAEGNGYHPGIQHREISS